ncbi:MAG TPA: hypothetical protein VGR90_01525, partial [Acidimicrobiales bacterium]|nr:hypothetical protein [Acidimicrobiales bacterium]
PPRSFDRTHHHPRMRDWEPGKRQYEPAMTEAPVEFVAGRLADLEGLLEDADVQPDAVDPEDADDLRRAVPEIVAAVERLLTAVHSGEAAAPPAEPVAMARTGWL